MKMRGYYAVWWLITVLLITQDPVFSERSEISNLDFLHNNGMCGKMYLPEITGQGGAFLDFDNDGKLDVYLLQGGSFASFGGCGEGLSRSTDRLFRNEPSNSPSGASNLRFTDVTAESGIDAKGYGMGVATGDFTNNGFIDLYITNLGSNQLYRNNGDGTFTDVTARTGTDDTRWSTSATFFDFDRDGFLDLFVANYVDFTVQGNRICYSASSAEDYCGPDAYTPEPDRLFRNRGDGTFEDVTTRSGIASEFGAALGVVAADLNGDSWVDLYVANDGDPNLLWINQRDGTFVNDGLLAGVALNQQGVAEASMGVDAADIDEDGDEDLFLAHIMKETNTLYLNEGNGFFEDRTIEAGLALPSMSKTAFGTGWFDYDNDGWLDLLVLNGAVTRLEELARQGEPYPLQQPNQLFHNNGDGSFREVTDQAGDAFVLSEVSRGAAFGDIDNDGDTDVLITNSNGPARLLINESGDKSNWIGFRLVNSSKKRDMLGARLKVSLESGRSRFRRVKTDGSYCSASDPRVIVGLGDSDMVESVQVIWPDGETEEWKDLPVNRYHLLVQGQGK